MVSTRPPLAQTHAHGSADCLVMSTLKRKGHSGDSVADVGQRLGAVCWLVHSENRNQLVSVGALGEVLLEGPAVGRRYFGQEGETR